MSEQKPSYMAQLDAWTEESVIEPLAEAYLEGPQEIIPQAEENVRQAIREKVLESYRNGQTAAPRKFSRRK